MSEHPQSAIDEQTDMLAEQQINDYQHAIREMRIVGAELDTLIRGKIDLVTGIWYTDDKPGLARAIAYKCHRLLEAWYQSGGERFDTDDTAEFDLEPPPF